jgi:hypothetical protein
MRKPPTVTQDELAAVVASYEAVEKDVLRIRRNLRAGAAVEPGALECHSQPGALQISPAAGYSLFGLGIYPRGSGPLTRKQGHANEAA